MFTIFLVIQNTALIWTYNLIAFFFCKNKGRFVYLNDYAHPIWLNSIEK